MPTMSRRRFSLGALGLGTGAFAAGHLAGTSAQEATPGATGPVLGYASLRVRALASPELVPEIDQIVITEFVPQVQALPGYQGYLLGDVIENPNENLSVVIFEQEDDAAAFNETAQRFVAGLDPRYQPETPTQAEGDLLIAAPAGPVPGTPAPATVAATPVSSPALTSGYVAVRLYTSAPGMDVRDIVPLVISDFVPILREVPGFQGYLWFVTDSGLASINLFDTEASAAESTALGQEWAMENVAGYLEGNPQVINAAIAYADLPILTR